MSFRETLLPYQADAPLGVASSGRRDSKFPWSCAGTFDPTMTKQALIIGAGPGGLASAILLAAAGVRVKIVERLPIIGGRTSSIEADGYKFDLGPTFFLYPRVLEEIFRAAGTTLQSEVQMARLDPQYRIQFGAGGKLDCTAD